MSHFRLPAPGDIAAVLCIVALFAVSRIAADARPRPQADIDGTRGGSQNHAIVVIGKALGIDAPVVMALQSCPPWPQRTAPSAAPAANRSHTGPWLRRTANSLVGAEDLPPLRDQ